MNVIIGIILFCVAMFLVAFYLYEFGKENAKHFNIYDDLYKSIQNQITNPIVTDFYYDYIDAQIQILQTLKYKDKDKTQTLIDEFSRKFISIGVERLRDKLTVIEVKRQDEHSPESIF